MLKLSYSENQFLHLYLKVTKEKPLYTRETPEKEFSRCLTIREFLLSEGWDP